jgi:hypothetical protein
MSPATVRSSMTRTTVHQPKRSRLVIARAGVYSFIRRNYPGLTVPVVTVPILRRVAALRRARVRDRLLSGPKAGVLVQGARERAERAHQGAFELAERYAKPSRSSTIPGQTLERW